MADSEVTSSRATAVTSAGATDVASTAAAGGVGLSPLPDRTGRAGLPGVLRSEATKIRSVRSTYWSLVVLLAVEIGLAAVIGWAVQSRWHRLSPLARLAFQPTETVLGVHFLGQLIIAVLGAIVLTAEYSTGMIRTSLTAMPRRGTLYLGKAVVFAVVAVVVGLIASFCAFLVGQALLAPVHADTNLGAPGVLGAVVGSGLYLALCGLFAFGIGGVLRHTAGAITAAIGLLFVPPIIVNFLPASWQIDITRWLPSSAGTAISSTSTVPHMFPSWGEFAVFAAYTAVVLIAGAVLFQRRDA